ncbi:LSU ribosomal protein L10P [Neolewinella xylanilytica]|uniref:Large ribosomal subunit protein uL10 n=1 Tax=Neolewinella xylanilytica TaxID=1514080 RepID=A0A2S6I3X6_9BACT|nr:50S ribosomal protein L10 [Neolewinella xylanilytica]PPK85884.1 LSU ribosomal protein L10P [Neolewinella xylanilytica]
MNKTDKAAAIESLKERFANNEYFYIADASTLSVEQVNKLRGICFKRGVSMQVVKNTLARKALEQLPEENNYAPLFDALKGPTAILFAEVGNAPAKVIKEFREEKGERPILKAAYIATSIYSGDNQLDVLAKLKSRDEVLADILTLLQSPMQNLLSGLKGQGSKLAGALKTLEEREA